METEIKTNAMPQGEEMTEKAVETTEQLVENRVFERNSRQTTEETILTRPLPVQTIKIFVLWQMKQ